MKLDEEMAIMVTEMLEEFGTDIELTRTDPTSLAVEKVTLRGVFTDPVTYRIRPVELDPPAIRLIVDNKFAPQSTDRLEHSRGSWIITRVDPVQYADTPMGYRIEGMRG